MITGDSRAAHRVLLLDGGTGSELRKRGVPLDSRCWSAQACLTHPEVLKAIHKDYILAGADVITANTFATSRFVLAASGLDVRFEEVNLAAIAIAREAADSAGRRVSVAASLSCFPPAFDTRAYPDAKIELDAYIELGSLVRAAGADLLFLEMMQDTAHAVRASHAASATGLPYWIGISCRLDPSRRQLMAFDDADQPLTSIVETLAAFNPEGIAIMHSPLAAISPALEELQRQWHGPIGAYAEIAYAEDPDAASHAVISPENYARAARRWLAQGAALLGGCCGTGPAHIEALRKLIDG